MYVVQVWRKGDNRFPHYTSGPYVLIGDAKDKAKEYASYGLFIDTHYADEGEAKKRLDWLKAEDIGRVSIVET
jgi:hypothetical protein